MLYYDRKLRALAIAFAALAGFVDGIGFLKSGGLFVSFMSGNSTRLAIGLARAESSGIFAAALIFLFVFGVFVNVMIVDRVTVEGRKSVAATTVAILLAAAAIAQTVDRDLAAIGLLCLAMGATNAVFQRDGEVSIGVTYMTGTLVKLGYRLADAVRGRDRVAWLSYLFLWAALVGGGVCGAVAFLSAPIASLWIAVGWSSVLAITAYRIR